VNLIELVTQIDSEEKARNFIERMRWPDGVFCPRCGHTHVSRLEAYAQVRVREVRVPVLGYVWHDLPRDADSASEVAACRLAHLRVKEGRKREADRAGAWSQLPDCLAHDAPHSGGHEAKPGRQRAVRDARNGRDLRGREKRGVGPGRPGKKTAALGIIERSGRVVCKAVPYVCAREIMEFASMAIQLDAVDVIYTDQLSSYHIFNGVWDHKAVNHKLCYIDGDIHTNGIEGFWSLLKRGITGSFHHVSAKHLPRYLDEFMWRFNNRRSENVFAALLGNCERSPLSYAQLVG